MVALSHQLSYSFSTYLFRAHISLIFRSARFPFYLAFIAVFFCFYFMLRYLSIRHFHLVCGSYSNFRFFPHWIKKTKHLKNVRLLKDCFSFCSKFLILDEENIFIITLTIARSTNLFILLFFYSSIALLIPQEIFLILFFVVRTLQIVRIL